MAGRAAACASGELGASGCVAFTGDVWWVSVWRTILLTSMHVVTGGPVEPSGELRFACPAAVVSVTSKRSVASVWL